MNWMWSLIFAAAGASLLFRCRAYLTRQMVLFMLCVGLYVLVGYGRPWMLAFVFGIASDTVATLVHFAS